MTIVDLSAKVVDFRDTESRQMSLIWKIFLTACFLFAILWVGIYAYFTAFNHLMTSGDAALISGFAAFQLSLILTAIVTFFFLRRR